MRKFPLTIKHAFLHNQICIVDCVYVFLQHKIVQIFTRDKVLVLRPYVNIGNPLCFCPWAGPYSWNAHTRWPSQLHTP